MALLSPARASDYKNSKHRLFVDVKRVFVYVDDDSYAVTPEQVPSALKKENLEEILLKAYRERFSSTDCEKWLDNRNPYSCDNQPVMLVPEQESSSFSLGRDTSFASQEELHDPGTLCVVLRVAVHGNLPDYDPPLVGPVVTIQLIQERPQTDLPMEWRVAPTILVPLNQKQEAIENTLLRYLVNRIN